MISLLVTDVVGIEVLGQEPREKMEEVIVENQVFKGLV